MRVINNVTLICLDCSNYGAAAAALKKSMTECEFEKVVFLTDIPISLPGIEVIQVPTIKSKKEYSKFIVKELYKYFNTDYVLVCQHDGFVLHSEVWDDDFYNYDYIGAPWIYEHGRNVGNGGFSLRSRRLQGILGTDELIDVCHPEDQSICILYGDYLKDTYGIKFASEEVADRFSFELREPTCRTFGFHGKFHSAYRPTVVIKRPAALGDCIILEPVMRYYALKGYNVVLDIPLPYFELYNAHYFKVTHISNFDSGRIKPEKVIDLTLAYEVKPRQNYLKSYFEFSGIEDYELTRPQLYPLVNHQTKLFPKYAIVHIDRRITPERNPFGINWKNVQRFLENRGYLVVQIGKNEREECGIQLNTPSIGFMKFAIAGADLAICVDSAPSHIAMAYNKPCVLLFGSTRPDYIHAEMDNTEVIQCKCDKSGCWHVDGSVDGQKCFYSGTDKYLQCCKSDSDEVISAIERLITSKSNV